MLISLNSLPHFIGACLFFVLAARVALQPVGSNTKAANRFLITLFLIFAVLLLDEFFVTNAVVDELFTGSDTLLNASHLLLGPLTYCYISAMLTEKSFTYNRLFHFIPFTFFLVISTFEQVISSDQDDSVLIHSFILLYLATLLPYILFSLRALRSYLGEAKGLMSNLENHNLNWARVWLFFMLGISLYVTFGPVVKLMYSLAENSFNIHYVITLAAILLLVYPDASNQLSLADNPGAALKFDLVSPNTQVVEPYLRELYSELTAQMVEKKFYLTNGLTLADISQYIGVSTNLVSAALNQVGTLCFYDYVNNFRVERAKQLLLDYPSRAIIDIAMEAGFNSKSAFYTAFAKREKLSPSQYRKKVKPS